MERQRLQPFGEALIRELEARGALNVATLEAFLWPCEAPCGVPAGPCMQGLLVIHLLMRGHSG